MTRDLLKEGECAMTAKKHILVVTQYFYPENFRINDMCQEWIKRGYKVTVVTGIPNYPKGKFFKGYGLTKRRKESWSGIDVIRIPLIPRGKGLVGLMANYLSFMIFGYFAGKTLDVKADYVFSYEVSPMTQVIAGISFAKRLKVPHYLYVQDLWPENVIAVTGINSAIVIKPINKMVDYIYRAADEIFVTSPSFVNAICNREKKVPIEKVHYWPQYAEDFYLPLEKKTADEIPHDESFKIVFTGNIGTAQGLQILPKVADLLRTENIRFVIIGDGNYLEEFKEEIRHRRLEDKFVMIQRQPAEKIPQLLTVCDVAFVSFADNDLWRMTIPAKLQSYMACGMPIVASAEGETERIINEAECGFCIKSGDEKALADAILKIRDMDLYQLSSNSRKYFELNFSKKMLMDQIEKYFV